MITTKLSLNKKGVTDFAKERNLLLKNCKTDWAFFVDPDEIVTPELEKEIKDLDPNGYSGFFIKRKIIFIGQEIGEDKVLRLAKKDAGSWQRKVHEEWHIKGKTKTLKNPLLHLTGTDLSSYITKMNNFSDIHAKENIKEGKSPNLLKIILYPKLKFLLNVLSGRGFVFSMLQSFHSFLAWAKAWEAKREKNLTIKINWESIFLVLFLILFPFGQIIRLGFNFAGFRIPLQPIDLVVGLSALYTLFFQDKSPKFLKAFLPFILLGAFSFTLFIPVFGSTSLYGAFYLLRLISYGLFIKYTWNFAQKSTQIKRFLTSGLLAMSFVSAVFGWLQFVSFPDIKPFFVYNWDMHLFRLVGTFLDPTFLGLILVFGILITTKRFIEEKGIGNFFLGAFLLISLAFTYSRTSYLAFATGLLTLILLGYKKYIKQIIILLALFSAIVFILPTSRNHSIELFRSFSAVAKIDNYQLTLQIFSKSPVFGTGLNNMCAAYNKFIGYQDFSSHACSGSDSSILMVLATTGVAGLIALLYAFLQTLKSMRKSPNFHLIIASLTALFIHSLFSNSLFYPWVLGYLAILVPTTEEI